MLDTYTIRDISASAAGVYVALTMEFRKAMFELKSTSALAIVAPANTDGQGQEVHEFIENVDTFIM